MIKASSILEDVLQQIAKEENGDLTHDDFNRLSKRAELRLLWWLTGDVRSGQLPAPYETQKNKDMVSPFIQPYKGSVDANSQITRPADYYQYENMFSLEAAEGTDECEDDDNDCGDEEKSISVGKTQIKLLDNQQFNIRANTYIESLKPSARKPIAKQVGTKFEFLPLNLQGVTLEYIRYPKYAKIVTKNDAVYNQPVVDETKTENFEWDSNAADLLVYIIVDLFSNSVRESSLKQFNESTGKGLNK